jgi:hypothetical protein
MDAVLTLRNDVHDLTEPILPGITRFKGTSRAKANIMNCKHHCIEQRGVPIIERTVDKHVALEIGRSSGHVKPTRLFFSQHCITASLMYLSIRSPSHYATPVLPHE